jgi:tetratricopeptide (TPR) repeat protein
VSEAAGSRQRIPFFSSEADFRRTLRDRQQVLARRYKALGRDHPDVLAARDELGLVLIGGGKPIRAIPVLKSNLSARGRTASVDDPDILTTAGNLAIAYVGAGAAGRAVPLLKKLLSDQQRVLGDDHDETQLTRNNLGMAHLSRRQYQAAIVVLEQALTVGRGSLGDGGDDADAGGAAGSLATVYVETGDFGRALPLLDRVLAASRRLYGEGDDRTLLAGKKLALAYQAAGDLDRAMAEFDRLVADRERYAAGRESETLLGARREYDRVTLEARAARAQVYLLAGRADAAVAQLTELLPDCQRRLGARHRLTKTVARMLRRRR